MNLLTYDRRMVKVRQRSESLGNVLITTLMSRLVGLSVLDPVQPDASATLAILGTQFQPDSPAGTSPSVLPKNCLGMPLV